MSDVKFPIIDRLDYPNKQFISGDYIPTFKRVSRCGDTTEETTSFTQNKCCRECTLNDTFNCEYIVPETGKYQINGRFNISYEKIDEETKHEKLWIKLKHYIARYNNDDTTLVYIDKIIEKHHCTIEIPTTILKLEKNDKISIIMQTSTEKATIYEMITSEYNLTYFSVTRLS